MKPNPIAQKAKLVTQKTITFFDKIFTAFFDRQRPDSTVANPRFMKKTRAAVIRTQTVSAITFRLGPAFSWARQRVGTRRMAKTTIERKGFIFFILILLN
jgi:hypothetical protein